MADNVPFLPPVPNSPTDWYGLRRFLVFVGQKLQKLIGQTDIPPGVQTFTATTTATGVRLDWNPVQNAVSYRIYRSGTTFDEAVLIAEVYGSQNSYFDSFLGNPLILTSTRNYWIRAVNRLGDPGVVSSQPVSVGLPISGNVPLIGPTAVATFARGELAVCNAYVDGEGVALVCDNKNGDANHQYAFVVPFKFGTSTTDLPFIISTGNADGTFPRLGVGASNGGNFGGAPGVIILGANGAVPTGGTNGYMGHGTLNVAGGIYLNGTAYTNPDFVFEKFHTGKVTQNDKKPGAAAYTGLRPLEALRQATQNNHQLPVLQEQLQAHRAAAVAKGAHPEGDDIFARTDALLACLEEAYLYIFQLHDRIKALEAK